MFLGEGAIDEALALFGLNAEMYAEAAGPHRDLGLAHLARGELEPALASYERAAELDPADAEAARKIGEIRAELDASG